MYKNRRTLLKLYLRAVHFQEIHLHNAFLLLKLSIIQTSFCFYIDENIDIYFHAQRIVWRVIAKSTISHKVVLCAAMLRH